MTLIYMLVMLLNIYTWVIIIRAVMSWVVICKTSTTLQRVIIHAG